MSDSSQIQSIGNGNSIPKHQTIGRNGSFWMPKDSPDIKQTSTLNSKSSKNDSSVSPKTTNSHSSKQSSNLHSSNRSNVSFERAILSESSKISPRVSSTNNFVSKQNTNPTKQDLVKPALFQPSVSTKSVKASALTARPTVILVPKEPTKTPLLNEPTHRSTNRDNQNQDSRKKNKDHGTKNAQSLSSMNLNDKEPSVLEVGGSNSSTSDSVIVLKLVNLISKAVSPRISYTNKFSKKVVRFAIDLPNGEKLGVRIEK
ncbi:MAG: hypothetical protein HN489_10975, partial [Opitutae bacterium]|nr:hypothetical protein [Opitutae bacterium]